MPGYRWFSFRGPDGNIFGMLQGTNAVPETGVRLEFRAPPRRESSWPLGGRVAELDPRLCAQLLGGRVPDALQKLVDSIEVARRRVPPTFGELDEVRKRFFRHRPNVVAGELEEAIRSNGLRVESIHGDFALAPAETRATDDPTTIGPVDIVLFTVKSYDTDSAAATLAPLVGPETAVISLQNGIDNEERIAAVIGAEHVVGGVAWIFAGIAAPGVVRHTGGPARIAFGELDGRRSGRLETFLTVCQRAAIPAEIADDIRVALWTKYAFICAQAGLTAATRQPIGVIRDTPATWARFRAVIDEALSVGRAEGVPLAQDLVDRQVAAAAGLDPGLFSSLHDDLVGGRPMELDALLGELVRRAERAGVVVPTTTVLHAILLPQANARR